MSAVELGPGLPDPLGATLREGGVNVAVVSAHARALELCLFDADGREQRIALSRTRDVWHRFVRGPGVGPGLVYGLRAHGPHAPVQGHCFDPTRVLLDPYAREIVACPASGTDHPDALVARVAAPLPPGPLPSSGVRVPAADTIVYELHVKGFSKLHPAVPEPLRGTFAGLAHPACVEHLRALGITTVSLLPVHYALSEAHLLALGLRNYWGYNTIGWFCPDPRLSSQPGDPTATRAEFRAMVDALHRAGLELVIDVVFNHSAEGDQRGPTLSLRGLDNALYYRLEHVGEQGPKEPARYVNWSGCGNTLDASQPRVVQQILDSLRYWVGELGVDGFRFDLAPALARSDPTSGGAFDRGHPLLVAIAQDPILARAKLIAEPWDLGPGGYQLGQFPGRWLEWNDRYRDGLRRYWLRGPSSAGRSQPERAELASRLAGSSDRFDHDRRRPSASVNFVSAHDGMTLADLVSYAHKHNLANGEHGRDGHARDHSINCGVEGPSDAPEIRARRARLRRALIASLLVSRGTPMLLAGDELGNSQAGNNNAYCQDNPISWLDWSTADAELLAFVRGCVALRQRSPALRRDTWLSAPETTPETGGETRGETGPERTPVHWRRPDGEAMGVDDWHDHEQRGLSMLLDDPSGALLVLLNAEPRALAFSLPPGPWRVDLDSDGPRAGAVLDGHTVAVGGESLLVLTRSPRS